MKRTVAVVVGAVVVTTSLMLWRWASIAVAQRSAPVTVPLAALDAADAATPGSTADDLRQQVAVAENALPFESPTPDSPEPQPAEDWLLHRQFAPPQASAERREFLLGVQERYKSSAGVVRYSAAYLATCYAVATILDRQNRTAPPQESALDGPRPDEWGMLTMQARYVFPREEFPVYTEARSLYILDFPRTLGIEERCQQMDEAYAVPFPAGFEERLDKFVEEAVKLLADG